MRKIKQATTTALVLDALVRADDFLDMKALIGATGRTHNQISAALHSMRVKGAVKSMESDGKLWWYATPAEDTRAWTVAELTPESRPRRPRKPRAKPATGE